MFICICVCIYIYNWISISALLQQIWTLSFGLVWAMSKISAVCFRFDISLQHFCHFVSSIMHMHCFYSAWNCSPRNSFLISFFYCFFSFLMTFHFSYLYHVLFISLFYTHVLCCLACLAPKQPFLSPLFFQRIFPVYLSQLFLETILQIDFAILFLSP